MKIQGIHRVIKTSRGVVCLLMGFMTTLSMNAQQMTNTDTHSQYIMAVDEYVPAPGQWINVLPLHEAGDDAATMARKCTECLAANQRTLVSLGGYGGYITFHFDHSIANIKGMRDFLIEGNAFQGDATTLAGGSAEPGIVMVSKDINHNGRPDDPWYELSGSADVDSIGKLVFGYEITYRQAPLQDIPWSDNQGGSGLIERLEKPEYRIYNHTQEYYPLWLPDALTFHGTLLPPNGIDTSGRGIYWVQTFLREGYVDNKPNADKEANSFDIGWAVNEQRQFVDLDFIDFVRVYTAVNQFCGRIGETSTEIIGAKDLHLNESVDRIREAITGICQVSVANATIIGYYSTEGKCIAAPRRGLNLLRMSDGTTRKVIIQ